ncbi:MAG TPA: alpha/beta hydrolase [Flavobacteriales bacterium]|nr:alpha/beta hydrolase [Flavobacteriales bacterium]
MSALFFLCVLTIAFFLLSINLWAPLRCRIAKVNFFSFLCGFTLGGLPWHFVVVEIAVVAFLSCFVAKENPWVHACWGLGGVSLLLIILHVLQGRRFYHQIGEQNGSTEVDEGALDLGFWQKMRPLIGSVNGVKRVCDIPFRHIDGQELCLDIYRPEHTSGKTPVLLYIHGGAWIMGYRKYQGLPLLFHLAARGWTVVSVDYRLSPRATFPEHLEDVRAAQAWLEEHALEYGLDLDRVVVAGTSAGAHLAALLAFESRSRVAQGLLRAHVKGALLFAGIYDVRADASYWHHDVIKKIWARYVLKKTQQQAASAYIDASPIQQVSSGVPPVLLVHGSHDNLVPAAESKVLLQEINRVAPGKATYVEVPAAQHSFEYFYSLHTRAVLQAVDVFMQRVAL